MCVYILHAHHGAQSEARGPLLAITSLLPPCEFTDQTRSVSLVRKYLSPRSYLISTMGNIFEVKSTALADIVDVKSEDWVESKDDL